MYHNFAIKQERFSAKSLATKFEICFGCQGFLVYIFAANLLVYIVHISAEVVILASLSPESK